MNKCGKCGKYCDPWDLDNEGFISMVNHKIYCKECFLKLNPQPRNKRKEVDEE